MSTAEHANADEERLAQLGYKQELKRGWTGFQNFAISFTIISVLAGCFTTYGQAWNNGGPVAISWGWPIIIALILTVAFSMSELASSFPTAGAIYWWSARLGGRAWGWYTGWFNLIGLIGVVASVDYACATFLNAVLGAYGVDTFGLNFGDDAGILKETFILFVIIVLSHVLINIFSSPLVGRLNAVSVWWHVLGVLAIVIVLVVVPAEHASFDFVFTERINNSGFGEGMYWFYVLPLGFLLTMYTVTGYDASAHVSEETTDASISAAKGVWRSVFWSGVIGWVVLLAITFAAADATKVTEGGGTSIAIFEAAMSTAWVKFILIISTMGQLFCGMSCVTSGSRMTYAFSRDGAIPGHRIWTKLNHHRVPYAAVLFIGFFSILVTVPALWGNEAGFPFAFFAVVSITVIGLYIAYVIPIYLRWRQGSSYETGPWTLGNKYKWLNPIAIIWVILSVIIFSLPFVPSAVPWNADFSWEAFNYAPVTVLAVIIFAALLWIISGRKTFHSPAEDMEKEAHELEAELGAPPKFPEAP